MKTELQNSFFLRTRLRWVLWWRLSFLIVLGVTTWVTGLLAVDVSAERLLEIVILGIAVSAVSFAFIGKKEERRKRTQKSFAFFQIAFDGLLASLLIAETGGLYSAFILLYGLNIIVAGVLLLAQGALIATVGSVLAFGATSLLLLNWSDWDSNNVLRFFFVTLGLSVVGYLVRHLMKNRDELIESLEQASESLKDLEKLQAALVDHMPLGALLISQQGQILYANGLAQQWLGDGAVGKTLTDLEFEWDWNKSFWEFSCRFEKINKRFRAQQVAIQRDKKLILFEDLTRIRQMEESLRRQERLASVGQLAAGLAHEIKNPLASLSGSIQVLRETTEDKQSSERLMSIILRETDRLDHLVQNFLDYAKPSRLQLSKLEIKAVFSEVIELIENELRAGKAQKRVYFELDCPDDLNFECDARQIRQVFWNLLGNAVEAIDDRGHIAIRCHSKEPNRVRIEVEDTGCGMSADDREKIFEPFFTKRPNGTGLGLALVYQIIEAHGAEIGVESAVGKGSLFWMEFWKNQPKKVLDESERAA